MPPSLQAMAPVSASSDYHASWIYHTGGASLWGWMVPYAIFKGLNTLKRQGRRDLMDAMKAYVEDGEFAAPRRTRFGMNAFTPLSDKWYRHLPIREWGDLLKETAPYMADHTASSGRRSAARAAPGPVPKNLSEPCHSTHVRREIADVVHAGGQRSGILELFSGRRGGSPRSTDPSASAPS